MGTQLAAQCGLDLDGQRGQAVELVALVDDRLLILAASGVPGTAAAFTEVRARLHLPAPHSCGLERIRAQFFPAPSVILRNPTALSR